MKRALLLVVLLCVVVAGGWALYRVLFPEDSGGDSGHGRDAAAAVASAPAASDGGVALAPLAEDGGSVLAKAGIVDVRGLAQKRQPDGRWVAVAAGEQLTLDDAVRTLGGGAMLVRLGNAVQVRLTPHTEVTIRELTERASRVRIEEGRIVAEVNPQGKTVLRVEAKGSQATAEANSGSFSMISDGRGQVAVATSAGSVRLSAGGSAVEVPAGQAARVEGQAAPTAPMEIPRALFLKVAAPQREIQRERETVISGTTTPGALVRVGGQVAQVDARGQFRVKVPLQEGTNKLDVQVTDVAGNERQETIPPIVVDTREPAIKNTEVHWGGSDR
ncbi:MAG: FecR domain-containing protein [Deltaproteobacteria bacterium]|nr:FecR domain-containing protein [Deltaproteobacteria bacterium]